MKTDKDDYRISFFNPTTKHARIDRNLALWLVGFWAVAVFGFQIALRVLEQPTPEKTLVVFESVWDDVREGNAGLEQNQKFINSCLSVIGKQSVKPEHLKLLKNAYGAAVFNLIPEEQKAEFEQQVSELKQFVVSEVSMIDPAYLQLKSAIASTVGPLAGIDADAFLYEIIHIGLLGDMQSMTAETKSDLLQIMQLYTTHNQSVLTNFTFLGFPFHYFYSAVLLLIFFVGICWFYCYKVDKVNVRLGTEEK